MSHEPYSASNCRHTNECVEFLSWAMKGNWMNIYKLAAVSGNKLSQHISRPLGFIVGFIGFLADPLAGPDSWLASKKRRRDVAASAPRRVRSCQQCQRDVNSEINGSALITPINTYSQLFTAMHSYSQLFTAIHSYSQLFTAIHSCKSGRRQQQAEDRDAAVLFARWLKADLDAGGSSQGKRRVPGKQALRARGALGLVGSLLLN